MSSAGDVNGDGFADVIVGAPRQRQRRQLRCRRGLCDLRQGRRLRHADRSRPASPPPTGFKIQGDAAGDLAGASVSSAGDVNGDGFADLIVGAMATTAAATIAGAAYVIFGKARGFGT